MAMTLRTLLAALAASALLMSPAHAAKFRDFDGYRVHYSAFNSTVIAPEIAQAYGLNRSHYRGILNVTVQRKSRDQLPFPAANADLQVKATNRANQTKHIEMQRIEEGDAIYYIGEFPVTHQELLDFQVSVAPEGTDKSYDLSFRQQFFTSEKD